MRLRVLGCHGGESPTHRLTSFLVDGSILLDAGAATRSLTLAEQRDVETIVISHAHLDHIRDLGPLCDNIIGQKEKPVELYCTDQTAAALETHFFNNVIWPDFTKIPNPADPVGGPTLRMNRIEAGIEHTIGAHQVMLVPVNHPVETHAIFLRAASGTLCFSSDTGKTEALFRELNERDDLRAFIYEVSFPNAMEKLAEISGHLTPQQLADELAEKFKPQDPSCPILLYHLKPGFFGQLQQELAALGDSRLTVLRPLDEFDF